MKTKTKLSLLLIMIITFSFSKISQSQFIDPENDGNVKPLMNENFKLPTTEQKPPFINGDTPFPPYWYVIYGNNSTSGNGRAPQGSRRYIRTVYLIPEAELYASGFGISTVRSVGWNWNNPNGAGSPLAQNIQTTGNIKIYLQNTTDVNYSKGLDFPTAISGMTLVANTTITIPTGLSQIEIDVPCEGFGVSCFKTENLKGVYVAFDYETILPLATPVGAPTVHCDGSLVGGSPGLATYQSSVQGTAMVLSSFRPSTRFSGGQPIVAGDVNFDGVVDLDDMAIVECEAMNFCCYCTCRGDLTNDICVDGADIYILSNKLCLFLE